MSGSYWCQALILFLFFYLRFLFYYFQFFVLFCFLPSGLGKHSLLSSPAAAPVLKFAKVVVAFTPLAVGSKSAERIIPLPWVQQTGNTRRQVPLRALLSVLLGAQGVGGNLAPFLFLFCFLPHIFPSALTTVWSLFPNCRQNPEVDDKVPLLSLCEMSRGGKHPQEHSCV